MIHKFLVALCFFICFYSNNIKAQAVVTANRLFSPKDTAFVPKEIEDPECIGINKLPYHATLMPYLNKAEALRADRHASSYYKTLNGVWKFNWVDWPQKRPVDFYKENYDVSAWADINVPSNWGPKGYGTPDYSNWNYIFQSDFPKVMSTPPVYYTTYRERNPVGSYKRSFEIPQSWNGRRIFVTFDGVDAGFFVWVNGKKVGYSVNSRNAAEFDITDYVHTGKNNIAVEVYRFTSGSYLEDQDMWKMSGIFRNVSLWSAPQMHLQDFYITTDLDAQYNNAVEHVKVKVKNYSSDVIRSKKVKVELYDGSKLISTAHYTEIPVLAAGEEKELSLEFPVTSPVKWTAETPYLYTTVISIVDGKKEAEIVSSKTGFRKIEIKGRQFLVNGVPIKLKGVNRHEHWPDNGHAITEAQMLKDLLLIKQANCNHVRTCHYSDDPRWYELCDEYGIYLVAEANLECHGAWNRFNEEPTMKAAIIDRNVANVENFKNHPSVIIWSLGNECGSGGSNFRAALNTIKKIDPTRPTHYEGFGIGADNPADLDSRMYTDVYNVEKIAKDNGYKKPFYLCEYAHTMFNSMGSIDRYNELFDKYPNLLGGAVWEWQDQGLYNYRDPNHPITAYGGGFGEFPNDKYFIHKGVVFSDRKWKPQYPELKRVYQWISVTPENFDKQIFTFKNRYQFTNLDSFSIGWKLSEDGIEVEKGTLKSIDLAPGNTTQLHIPYKFKKKNGKEYFLEVSFYLTKSKLWADKGYEIANVQIELPKNTMTVSPLKSKEVPALQVNEGDKTIGITGEKFSVVFDKQKGTFTSMKNGNNELIASENGPMLHLWRAPHRDDDMWAYWDWDRNGLKELKWNAQNVTVSKVSGSQIMITADLTGTGKNNFSVKHRVQYTVSGNGEIRSDNTVNFNGPHFSLARVGVRMILDKSLDTVSYFARGPMENYADRKIGSNVGVYHASVASLMTGYEKPMENGNHEDMRWVSVSTDGKKGIQVKSGSSLLQFSVLPYTDEEMENVAYKIDLPKSTHTVLCVSYKTLGVGSNGCGPRPLDEYKVMSDQSYTFDYMIRL